MQYLVIAIGSALGGMARYGCSGWIAARLDSQFPWGTLFVNVMGSFLIGAAMGILDPGSRLAVTEATRLSVNQFFMIGMLGGFTTFSSFSLQTLVLMREHQWLLAGGNVLLSVLSCLLAVAFGYWLGTR